MITMKTVQALERVMNRIDNVAGICKPFEGDRIRGYLFEMRQIIEEIRCEVLSQEPAAQPFYKILAVDFDGCLCDSRWPDTGDPIQEVVDAVKRRRDEGWKTILWTCRSGEALEKAVRWCEDQGLVFDAVNDNIQEMKDLYGNDTRKVSATEYWDDRAVHVGISHEGTSVTGTSVGEWIEDHTEICCPACGKRFTDEVTCCDIYGWPWRFCPGCGNRIGGD